MKASETASETLQVDAERRSRPPGHPTLEDQAQEALRRPHIG